MMPIAASLLAPKSPSRALLDGGGWATATNVVPVGQDALNIKYQYTYERFKESLGAKIVEPGESLDGIDELVIITPTTPFNSAFVQSVKNWTRKGGRLLIVADHTNLFGHQTILNRLISEFGIGIRPDALFETKTNGGVYSNAFYKFAGLTPSTISKGVIPRLKMEGWSEYPDYTANSFFGEMAPSNDDHYGKFPVFGSRRYGLGEVSVFTDSTFFANFAISRWSSQAILGSLFWSVQASIVAILAIMAFSVHLVRPLFWLPPFGIALILVSPSLGFRQNEYILNQTIVRLAPPLSVANNSEERDRGIGSALLASAYAFNIGIRWDDTSKETLKTHLQNHGVPFPHAHSQEIPKIELQAIAEGAFYIDQNSFWYGQGAGPLRAANMSNFWESLGIELPKSKLEIVNLGDKEINGFDGDNKTHHFESFSDGWVLIDKRIVARWIPEASKWLARREWQLGPWLPKDLLLEPVGPIE